MANGRLSPVGVNSKLAPIDALAVKNFESRKKSNRKRQIKNQ